MTQRGMVKWQPFASLPEQANYINRLIYEMNKIERPILSEDQLNELNEKLYRYYENKEMVSLEYFYDGYVYLVEGIIVKIDPIKKMIIMENNSKRDKFSIASIVNIVLK
ncbi:MAG TPA: YolD-like family protein [Haloplasmataceae bacterium]